MSSKFVFCPAAKFTELIPNISVVASAFIAQSILMGEKCVKNRIVIASHFC